jgi:hypothetical protein
VSENTLKSIIVIDLETKKYKPSAHNLSPDEAVNLARTFTEHGRTAKVIDQEARHTAPAHFQCTLCREAAEKAGNSEAPAGTSAASQGTTLKAVLRRDEKTKRYVPAGHNLSQEGAEKRAAYLQNDGFDVAIAVQVLRHKGRGFKNCEQCKAAAENLSGPPEASAETGTEEIAVENP